jgi:NTE family protein
MEKYHTLILEGGGVKGYAYPYALSEMENTGFRVRQINRFVGTSAGAITAALLACEANPYGLMRLMNVDFSEFKDDKAGYIRDAWSLIRHFGFCKGAVFKKWFGDCIEELTGDRNISFREVKSRYNNDLYVTATNLTRGRLDVFSPETSPHLRVVDAVRMSMSIPLFYRPVWYNSNLYVDGGVLSNFHDLPGDGGELGLRLVGDDDCERSLHKIEGLRGFISRIIETMMRSAERRHVSESLWENTISINTGNIGTTEFNLSDEQKIFLQKSAKKAVLEFIKSNPFWRFNTKG